MRFPLDALVLLLVLKPYFAAAVIPCGNSGAALFGADGDALRAAASCVLLGTKCDTPALLVSMGLALAPGATTDATAVGSFYGTSITTWCTGDVESFEAIFQDMVVRSASRWCL